MDVLFSILGSVSIVGAVITAYFRVIRPVMKEAIDAVRTAEIGNVDALNRLTDCQSQLAETLQTIRESKLAEAPEEGTDLVARVESLERRIEEIHQQAVSAYRRAAQARRDAEKRSRDYGEEEMEPLTEEERKQAEQLGLVEPSRERQGEDAQDPAVDDLTAIRARIRGER